MQEGGLMKAGGGARTAVDVPLEEKHSEQSVNLIKQIIRKN